MKTRLKKSLALLLLIVLSITNSSIAYAHTHKYTIYKGQDIVYWDSESGAYHTRVVDTTYECSCGKSMQFPSSTSYLPHSLTAYSYTGSHYHKGTRHYFEKARICIQCYHRDSYNEDVICGGPPCSLPY